MRYVGAERAVVVGVWRARGRARAAGQRRGRLRPGDDRDRARAQHAAARARIPATSRRAASCRRAEVDRPHARRSRRRCCAAARSGARWWPRRPRRRRCRPGCEQRLVGLAELVAHALANDDARARARRVARRGSCRPATRCAGGSSARCTRARTSTSSRSRSSCASRSAARSPAARWPSCCATCSPTRWRRAPSSRELARGLHPPCSPSAGSPPRCRRCRARVGARSACASCPAGASPDVVETTAYLTVAEALANVGRPLARDRVHAARRRPRRPADRRDPRQRDRRRRRRAPAAGSSASPTAPTRSARASRSSPPAAAARRSGSRSRLRADVSWRHSFRDRIRYGDLDTNAHLNNVAVHQFFESARIAYLRGLFPAIDPMGRAGGFGMIFAETHVRFASPGFYEEDLRVDVQAGGAAPRSSVQARVPDGLRGRRAADRRGLGHAGRATTTRRTARAPLPRGSRRAPATEGAGRIMS